MAGQGGEDMIEKSVNSADIPSTSESLNLWETEKIDHSILSYYMETKSPNSPVSVNPQAKIFTINLEPSKHFTSCRASYISFDIRLIKLPSHDKLPPIYPPPTQTSADVTSHLNPEDSNIPANDNENSAGIGQSEARPYIPLTQHECIGNKFVLEQDSDEVGERRRYEEKKEMEKKKKEERMHRWLKEQEEYRQRWHREHPERSDAKKRKMHCKQRRDLTTEATEHEHESKRRKMMDVRGEDRKRKRQTDCPTDSDMAFEMRKKRKKEEEKNIKDDPPAPTPYKGSNLDNAIGK